MHYQSLVIIIKIANMGIETFIIWMWISVIVASAIVGSDKGGLTGFLIGAIYGAVFGPIGLALSFRIDTRKSCPACGHPLNRGFMVCGHCGSHFQRVIPQKPATNQHAKDTQWEEIEKDL
jgi:hypothetical protein